MDGDDRIKYDPKLDKWVDQSGIIEVSCDDWQARVDAACRAAGLDPNAISDEQWDEIADTQTYAALWDK